MILGDISRRIYGHSRQSKKCMGFNVRRHFCNNNILSYLPPSTNRRRLNYLITNTKFSVADEEIVLVPEKRKCKSNSFYCQIVLLYCYFSVCDKNRSNRPDQIITESDNRSNCRNFISIIIIIISKFFKNIFYILKMSFGDEPKMFLKKLLTMTLTNNIKKILLQQ